MATCWLVDNQEMTAVQDLNTINGFQGFITFPEGISTSPCLRYLEDKWYFCSTID